MIRGLGASISAWISARVRGGDQRLVGLLHRDCADAQRLIETDWHAILEEPEERSDSGQSGIARPPCIAAILLDMIEEGQNHGHSNILDVQLRRRLAKLLGGERHEQLKTGRIGVAGVRAGTLVSGSCSPKNRARSGASTVIAHLPGQRLHRHRRSGPSGQALPADTNTCLRHGHDRDKCLKRGCVAIQRRRCTDTVPET